MKLLYRKFSGKLKAVVIDNIGGAYFPIAQHLSNYFDMSYYSAVQNPFPRMSTYKIGTGYDNIKVINEFWNKIDEYDLFIFPDISKRMEIFTK